jgi:hypothetical protein
MARFLVLITCIICGYGASAQFKLIGDADYMDNGCIMLTPDVPYSEGIAYSTAKLNLQHNFEIEFDIYLGEKDEGADGITFVIHNDRRGFEAFGTYGECMGYGTWSRAYGGGTYIAPSVAVEFDTYENGRQNDPASDHVAFLQDGSSFHTDYWNNKDNQFNLEDGYLHNFRFKWNPTNKKITVYLDGNIVYQGTKDLIKDVFKGATEVIWGFTASTGRKSNLQYFCLKRLAIRKVTPALPRLTMPQLLVPEVTMFPDYQPQQAQSQYARSEGR